MKKTKANIIKPDYCLDGNYPRQIKSMYNIFTNFGINAEEKSNLRNWYYLNNFYWEK